MASLRRTASLLCILTLLLTSAACGNSQPPASTAANQTLPFNQPQTGSPSSTKATVPSAVPTTKASTSAPTTEVTTPAPTTEATTPAPTSETVETSESTEPSETTPAGPSAREVAEAYLAQMDYQSKLYQLMIVLPEAICGDDPAVTADKAELNAMPVAGILYQAKNMTNKDQLIALVEGHQEASALPLFICVDEEGGRVSRIRQTMGTTPIKNMYTYRGDGPEKARKNALTLAQDISAFGFNLDFAPVADVWSNPENRVIGERAYSDSFTKAATLIAAAVRGFHEGNVICTLKHFPGHGDTLEDSHESAAVVQKTLKTLRQEEFLPFVAGIEAGADLVMIGHLTVPDIDPGIPATFSRKIVSDLLREDLGFAGVIITDSLEMKAATLAGTPGEVCLKALQAGCDILLCPASRPDRLTACVEYLLNAIQMGLISWERIDESVLRILELKVKYGLIEQALPAQPLPAATDPATTAAPEEEPPATTEEETTQAPEAETPAPAEETPAETEAWAETESETQAQP